VIYFPRLKSLYILQNREKKQALSANNLPTITYIKRLKRK